MLPVRSSCSSYSRRPDSCSPAALSWRQPSKTYTPPSMSRALRRPVQCAAEPQEPSQADSPADVGELARQMLDNDPEAAKALQGYKAALLRVETAQAAALALEANYQAAQRTAVLADAEGDQKQVGRAARWAGRPGTGLADLERQQAANGLAAAEESAAELRMLAAELQLELAQKDQRASSRAAERDADRVESGKAAAVAALGAAVCYLPLAATSTSGTPLSSALAFAVVIGSALLFGVTYRYAVRENANDGHLKGGVVTAFGLVRAGAAADLLQSAASSISPLDPSVAGPAALYAAQSMLLFGFAATAVEAAFNTGFLRRFKSAPSE